MCVRLKGLISSDNQENERSDNAAFLQILISFYTQSEVACVHLFQSPSLALFLCRIIWHCD